MSIMVEEEKKRAEEERDQSTKQFDVTSCDCADREIDQSMREKEVSSSIAFENALHNQVYVKRIVNVNVNVNVRRRRDAMETSQQYKDPFSDQVRTIDLEMFVARQFLSVR